MGVNVVPKQHSEHRFLAKCLIYKQIVQQTNYFTVS